ncbi:MAG TPA: hypothetical protein VLL52_03950 [Anaerolineae bacterium]|nr:hypothetical protein [Anaerolineae bacterium]
MQNYQTNLPTKHPSSLHQQQKIPKIPKIRVKTHQTPSNQHLPPFTNTKKICQIPKIRVKTHQT